MNDNGYANGSDEQESTQSENPGPSHMTPFSPDAEIPSQLPSPPHRFSRRLKLTAAVVFGILVLVAVLITGYMLGGKQAGQPVYTKKQAAESPSASVGKTDSGVLELDLSKNYGDKYNDGVLPVGDDKYTSDGPKQGYIYACSQYSQNLQSGPGGGAGNRGPWFSSDGSTYDIHKKAHVGGSVSWPSRFSNTVSGDTRTIVSNDLPSHVTGIYPIRSSDDAYRYDRNPNGTSSQDYTYELSVSPEYGSPNCMGGQVGVMLTGAAIFNGFDAEGRDAGAWEVQDDCDGHPEKTGEYHYHTLSSCIKDVGVSTVIGFALDGFPITGPRVGKGNIMTTTDLDECHGITSEIVLDGRKSKQYHYVMTEDFPYSVSCFRGTAIQPPGLVQRGGQPPR